MPFDLIGREKIDDCSREFRVLLRQLKLEVRTPGIERGEYPSGVVEDLLIHEGIPDRLGCWPTDRLLDLYAVAFYDPHQSGDRIDGHLPEGDAAILLVLRLERPGEILIALVWPSHRACSQTRRRHARRSGPLGGAVRGRFPDASSGCCESR